MAASTTASTARTLREVKRLLADRTLASRARAVRIPGFFSSADIRAVASLKEEHHAAHYAGREPPLARRNWTTTYLNADGLFRSRRPELFRRLSDLRLRVDKTPFVVDDNDENDDDNNDEFSTVVDTLLEGLQVRCIELHEGTEGGSLNDPRHYDDGSVVTVDILLDDAFAGGEFTTMEETTAATDGGAGGKARQQQPRAHVFSRGDALVFPSYKYHSVAPIASGSRSTLVLEFWDRDENLRNHRGGTVDPPPSRDDDAPIAVRFAEAGAFGAVFAFEDAADPRNRNADEIRDGRPVAARVVDVRDGTQAAREPRLRRPDGGRPGPVLTHVNGSEVIGMGFDDLDSVIARAAAGDARPVDMTFARR